MEFITNKKGKKVGIVVYINGEENRFSLRKIKKYGAIVSTIGLIAILAAAPHIKREISYELEMDNIEEMDNSIKKLESLTDDHIEINGTVYDISKEAKDYVEAREKLANLEHDDWKNAEAIKNAEANIKKEEQTLQDIALQVDKDFVEKETGYEGPANTHPEIYTDVNVDGERMTRLNYVPNGESFVANGTQPTEFGANLSGEFINASVTGNGENIVNGLPGALTNGEGIEITGGRTK